MSRFDSPSPDENPAVPRAVAEEQAGEVLAMVAGFFRVVATNSATLTSFVGRCGLRRTLSPEHRRHIAGAVAELCAAPVRSLLQSTDKTRTFAERSPTLDATARPEDIAAMRFACRLVQRRGRVSSADLAAIQAAGFTEPQVFEIAAVAAEGQFSSLFGQAFDTAPVAPPMMLHRLN